MEWIIAAFFMLISTVTDIKNKTIPISVMILFGIFAAVYAVIGNKHILEIIYSLTPGAFLLALSLCTRESIGYGDGLLVMVLGVLVGFSICLLTVISGMIISGVFALILLIFRKVNGKTRLPFIPFLTMGLGVAYIAGIIH